MTKEDRPVPVNQQPESDCPRNGPNAASAMLANLYQSLKESGGWNEPLVQAVVERLLNQETIGNKR